MRTKRNIRQFIPDIAFFAISVAFFSYSYKKLEAYSTKRDSVNTNIVAERGLASIEENSVTEEPSKTTIELDCQNPQKANAVEKGYIFFQIRLSHCKRATKVSGKNLSTGEALLFLPTIDKNTFLSNVQNIKDEKETNIELIFEEKIQNRVLSKIHQVFIENQK
ncbi:MAG: hypothetical protein M9962_11355 [Oligoflexia bacterium]|nr:hypothetical protein [Oligoflexia bacterium]